MLKRFFRSLRSSFCTYLLAILNLIHAITTHTFDWLLWFSLALVLLSLILNAIVAIKGGVDDA